MYCVPVWIEEINDLFVGKVIHPDTQFNYVLEIQKLFFIDFMKLIICVNEEQTHLQAYNTELNE